MTLSLTDYCPTVSELLSLPVFQGSRVLSGAAALGHPVIGVNLSDTPDYFKWLLPGELMISTCYAIHADPGALTCFVPHLAERKMAGLCIKPGQYLGQVPEVMVEQAEQLGMPLIQLKEGVRFSDITRAVSEELLKRQTAMLRSTLSVNEMLTRIIVEGADLNEVAGMVRELAGCSVLILDCINNRRALQLVESDRLRFQDEDQDSICTEIISGSRVHVLEVGESSFGFLYIYGANAMLLEQDEGVLTQVLQTIPLEISRERTVRESSNRMLDDFILHLLSDQITSEEREYVRAKGLGMDLRENHMVIHAHIREESGGNPYAAVFQRTMLVSEIASTAGNLGLRLHRVRRGEEHLLILSSPMDAKSFGAIARRFPDIEKKLRRECPALRFTVGCGAPHMGIDGLRRSDNEARVAFQAAANGSGMMLFSQLGLLRIVYACDPDAEIQAFVRETLGSLLDPDQPKAQELLHTLESYFRNFGNLKRVSAELYTHYNTVSYRVKSIHEMTGLDLRDPEERFTLELALRLYQYKTGTPPQT